MARTGNTRAGGPLTQRILALEGERAALIAAAALCLRWIENTGTLYATDAPVADLRAVIGAPVLSIKTDRIQRAVTSTERGAIARINQRKPQFLSMLDALRAAYDRGYFNPHPDDSQMEADEKRAAIAAIEEAEKYLKLA